MANNTTTKTQREYKCKICGKSYKNITGNFYKSANSLYFISNNGIIDVCVDCLKELFSQLSKKYDSDRMALIAICALTDWYYDESAYNTAIKNREEFSIGVYARLMNTVKYKGKTFITSVAEKKLGETTIQMVEQTHDVGWSDIDKKNRDTVIEIYGYDPFPDNDFSDKSRKYLFNTIIDFLDEETQEDAFKKSQIIQIVVNNEMIQRCNAKIASLDETRDLEQIKNLSNIITSKVNDNDKIAKENEISVRNRSNKKQGKGTFTDLQKELRLKNFDEAEANYYKQLQSEGSAWAVNQSMQAIKKNSFFDESDQKEIVDIQRELIEKKDKALDDVLEENRLLYVNIEKCKSRIKELENKNSELNEELTSFNNKHNTGDDNE